MHGLPYKPGLSLPEPLRALEIPSFTHTSVVVRLPEIARRTLAENQFPPETAARIQALVAEIPSGQVRRLDIPPAGSLAAGSPGWDSFVEPYLGMDWLSIPWFFAEEYFYVRLLEACGYFHPGPGYLRDPYAGQKRLGLETSRQSAHHLGSLVEYALGLPPDTRLDSFGRLLLADLWGNQNDLSMWPVSKNGSGHSGGSAVSALNNSGGVPQPQPAPLGDHSAANEYILANDIPRLLEYLAQRPGQARIDILLDNAGYELVADLAIADFLLTARLADEVVLHAKTYPVFVSDALIGDIISTIDWLCLNPHEPTRAMAVRLRRAILSDHLRLSRHSFWTSPLPAWEMPADLRSELAPSALLISKGDANYRRLLGDLHWPLDIPFHQVVSYFQPAVLALRTCKSEIAVGIPPERIPAGPPDWIYNGRYGLIQFAPPNGKETTRPA